jgi:hypothetical protein
MPYTLVDREIRLSTLLYLRRAFQTHGRSVLSHSLRK